MKAFSLQISDDCRISAIKYQLRSAREYRTARRFLAQGYPEWAINHQHIAAYYSRVARGYLRDTLTANEIGSVIIGEVKWSL